MRQRLVALLFLLATAPALAQSAGTDDLPADAPIRDLEPIVVSGLQPGPGLWKVSRDGNTLWILGTLSPLPKRMQWQSREVEAVIAQAQEVIQPPSVSLDSDVGVFRSLLLLPSLLGARKNPDDRRLEEVVPPELYARWQPLKARYIGGDRGVEQWRPIFAAQELYEAAIRKSGLALRGVVQPVVDTAAKQHDVRLTPVRVKLAVENPKAAIKEFARTGLADTDCFAKTLDRIETDLGTMRDRANAWATGDVDALRRLPVSDQYEACLAAITTTGLAQKLGFGDVRARVADAWLGAAETALANNQVTFATLPMSQLLKPDGYLAALQAKGYVVEAP